MSNTKVTVYLKNLDLLDTIYIVNSGEEKELFWTIHGVEGNHGPYHDIDVSHDLLFMQVVQDTTNSKKNYRKNSVWESIIKGDSLIYTAIVEDEDF